MTVRRRLFAAIAVAPIWVSAVGHAEPNGALPVIAMLPLKLLDTSAEPKDQSVDHARRLGMMTEHLATDLAATDLYRTQRIPEAAVRARCPDEHSECLLALARAEGAQLVFIGVVHKSSTLIMQMWARLVDAKTGRDVFSRDLNFRGDNDEAWLRAEAFLAGQIKGAALP